MDYRIEIKEPDGKVVFRGHADLTIFGLDQLISLLTKGEAGHFFMDKILKAGYIQQDPARFQERPNETEGLSDYYIDGKFVGCGSKGMTYEQVKACSDSLDSAVEVFKPKVGGVPGGN